LDIVQSNRLKLLGQSLLPSLSQTFSKSPSSFVEGVYPVYAERAKGCYLYDVDGNKYVDYLMALGPIVLGYGYESVNKAISEQLEKGVLFSLPHKIEINAAESLKKLIPCAEMTRFTKTGSDAVTAAVRGARAITKKDMIFYCGSGGVWDDWFSINTNRNDGIPSFNRELLSFFNYNDLSSLEHLYDKFKNRVAAVVMEPSVYDEPENDFLHNVKKLAHENDSLLIFDEILTGFRMSKGGGQEYFGIKPDIATFAKGIANGMPLGAVVGKSEYMKYFEQVFVSTTYGGEALSLAACVATIKEFENHPICDHMWKLGKLIKDSFNKFAEDYQLNAKCIGFPPRMKLLFFDETGNDSLLFKSLFLQELIEMGIFMHPNTILLSYSHQLEDIEYTLECMSKSLQFLKKSIDSGSVKSNLRGEIAKQVIQLIN
jgi:glutamate-1-semialdehyde aminotransferase